MCNIVCQHHRVSPWKPCVMTSVWVYRGESLARGLAAPFGFHVWKGTPLTAFTSQSTWICLRIAWLHLYELKAFVLIIFLAYTYMCGKLKDHSVACFDCITAFKVTYRWTSIKVSQGSYAVCRLIRCSCINEAYMSPALNRSSAITAL